MNSDGSSLLFRHPASGVRRTPLREFLAELERRVTRGKSFDCLVSDDRELRALNRQFRGKNHATDVLSFPNPNGAATFPNRAATRGSGAFLGEIAISLDRARAQASEHGHSLDDELRILMLHGALHLAGLDHESDNGEMARAERRWRKHFGLPAGLIDRTRESTHA
jgi:probable rRNA maturation factor